MGHHQWHKVQWESFRSNMSASSSERCRLCMHPLVFLYHGTGSDSTAAGWQAHIHDEEGLPRECEVCAAARALSSEVLIPEMGLLPWHLAACWPHPWLAICIMARTCAWP